jgi:hypothetical protein
VRVGIGFMALKTICTFWDTVNCVPGGFHEWNTISQRAESAGLCRSSVTVWEYGWFAWQHHHWRWDLGISGSLWSGNIRIHQQRRYSKLRHWL